MDGRAACRAMTPRESMQAVVFVLDQPGPVMPSAARKRRVGIFARPAYQPAQPILKPSTPFLTGANLSSSLRRRLGLLPSVPSIERRLRSQCPTGE